VLHDHETFEDQVDALKRRQAGFAKERLLQERKVKKLQGEKDKKVGGGRRLCLVRREGSRRQRRVRMVGCVESRAPRAEGQGWK